MRDNLEVAKECGAYLSRDNGKIVFDTLEELEAYTSRILASQQAAHDAEIAKLKEENQSTKTESIVVIETMKAEISTANERIAYLEGLVAVKDEALKPLANVYLTESEENGSGDKTVNYLVRVQESLNARLAISASAETVQAFRDKLTEPLRREVAMLLDAVQMYSFDHAQKLRENLQATAHAYEQEVEARGAVKAHSEYSVMGALRKDTFYAYPPFPEGSKLLFDRATSKKAG